MTKKELEKATGQELIEQRNYCGVDGYYGDYILDVNAEMLKRFNRLVDLEKENKELKTIKIPQLERKIASIRGAHSVDCKKLNAKIEQVERLKKQVSAMSKALVNVVSESDKIRDRLSKAIKVIKALRNDYYADAKRLGVWEQAEQFLNSEVEK